MCGVWSVDIPFFKQVIIMATVCDACGKRDNEVKSGTGIEPMGTRVTLRITDASDLTRDILKVTSHGHCGFSCLFVEFSVYSVCDNNWHKQRQI